jgi:predicted CXXCH cytochrome family protein
MAVWSGLVLCGLLLLPQAASAGLQASFLYDLQAQLNQPSAVRVSNEGVVYVLDGVNGRVVMFDQQGKVLGMFAAPQDTPFDLPMDLQLYGDKVIIADSGNSRLLLFSQKGVLLKKLPLPKDDQQVDPNPTGLALIDNRVYWSDRANSRICSTSLSTGEQLACWGEFGTQEGAFRYPFMMATDQDNYLYIVDVLNGRIQVFNERGRPFGAVARFGVTDTSLLRPNGISLENGEQMMVSDSYTGKILLFKGRSFTGLLKDEKGAGIVFDQPVGIARWQDRLYIVEMGMNRVRVLRLYEADGTRSTDQTSAHFSQPTRQDCVTCHLSWSEEYRQGTSLDGPMPPVGGKRMCMSCHHGAVIDSRTSLGQGEQHPDYYHPDKERLFKDIGNREDPLPDAFPYVENQTPYCGTCHTPHRFGEDETGLTYHDDNLWMRDGNEDSEFCRQCHESLYAEGEEKAREMGIHPVSLDLEEPVEIGGIKLQRVNCQSCHKVHGGAENSASLMVSEEEIGRLCAACHSRHHAQGLEESRRKGVHPVNVDLNETVIIKDQEITRLNCLSCHSVHAGEKQTPSLVKEHRDGQLCEVCHEQTLAVIDTDHDMRISAEESLNLLEETPREAGVCGSCHSLHRNSNDSPMLLGIGDRLPEGAESSHLARDRLCLSCHRDGGIGDKKLITEYTHPYEDIVMHSDERLMPLLNKDESVTGSGQIGCITCHDPHLWSAEHNPSEQHHHQPDKQQEGTALNSFLRLKQTQSGFCVECHGLETRVKYKYYHDKRSRPNRAEYLR